MNFFSKLFKLNTAKKQLFSGSILFDNYKIICIDFKNKVNNFEIEIDNIEYIYIYKTEYKVESLMIYQDGQKFIPVNFEKFNDCYDLLVERLSFIKIDFYQVIGNKSIIQKEIYRRKKKQNFEIIDDQKYHDYLLGFEIQSPEKEFVSWDLTLQEMIKNKNLFGGILNFAHDIKKFQYPVRIGNIIVQDFSFRKTASRIDVPV